MNEQEIFDQILVGRGLKDKKTREAFLSADYDVHMHDPFLLKGMDVAVERLKKAKADDELVAIYGDYDIDGLSATSVLKTAFDSFGIRTITYIPDRFEEGYGINTKALKHLKKVGASVVVTVDCGSTSMKEITWASKNGLEVIVTDHHNVPDELPPAIAVLNPKIEDQKYPFNDLAGVGVAFKLVQALQTKMDGLEPGQEKWLLDLVALGTVCDVVNLIDENRIIVKYGLKVMQKTRRPGLRALAKVSGIEMDQLNAMHLGFYLGPRLNAAGRLETAQKSLDLMLTQNQEEADMLSLELDKLNQERRDMQNIAYKSADEQASKSKDDVLVLAREDWPQGIVGIVAAKIMEKHKKPTVIMQILGDETKGSARSFGDYNIGDAFKAVKDVFLKAGGHAAAAGGTIESHRLDELRTKLNDHYRAQKLKDQLRYITTQAEVEVDSLGAMSEELYGLINSLAPFGNGNRTPVFAANKVEVSDVRLVGADGTHVKLRIKDENGTELDGIAFGQADGAPMTGDKVKVWFELDINEWQGRRTPQAMVKRIEML